MEPSLRRVLPACTGRAVDARAVSVLVAERESLAQRLHAFVQLFYTRFEGQIGGPDRALAVAGGQTAALVALLDTVLADCRKLPEPVGGLLRADALGAGLAARLLAEVDHSVHPDLAFAVGTLAASGPAVLLQDDEEAWLTWWRDVRRASGVVRKEAMEALFGPDPRHEIARMLLEMHVPEDLALAVAAGGPEDVDAGWQRVVLARDLGRELIAALGAADSGIALQAWIVRVGAAWGVPDAGARALIDEVIAQVVPLGQALALPATPWRSRELLLRRTSADAVDAIDLAVLAALQESAITALRARATRLQVAMTERVRVDPITDLSTLQVFVARLNGELSDPSSRVGALACVDVQDLGGMFAEEGLRTTDELLGRVAGVLDRAFADSELIARCGPGTFVIALPGSAKDARVQLERARSGLSRVAVAGRRGPLRVRVDTSVVDLSDLPMDVTAEAIIEAARQSLWAPQQTRWVRSRARV